MAAKDAADGREVDGRAKLSLDHRRRKSGREIESRVTEVILDGGRSVSFSETREDRQDAVALFLIPFCLPLLQYSQILDAAAPLGALPVD